MSIFQADQARPQVNNSDEPFRYTIRRVAVLGAGTMGARIAAHFANAGTPVLLLDVVAATGERNGLGKRAISSLQAAKPSAFASPSVATLIELGNFDDDLERLHDCDWILEAVAENLDIKRKLLEKVAGHLHPDAILTTNTSGLPVSVIAEQLPAAVRQRWFGTHFFNPPRFMRLVEIIATPSADPSAIKAVTAFCEVKLGKEAVPAFDVPNFIANRIGIFSLLNNLKLMEEQSLSVEELDILTGPVVGWPKSGSCRLADMIGIDVLGNISNNFAASGSDERPDVGIGRTLNNLIERHWFGDKSGQGFYKKDKGSTGMQLRMALDPATMTYREAADGSNSTLDVLKRVGGVKARLKAIFDDDQPSDSSIEFLRRALSELWVYSANRIGEVSNSLSDIDRAMVAGFNWELGPFAMWDAAGLERGMALVRAEKTPLPAAIESLLAAGYSSWYRNDGTEYFDVSANKYVPAYADPAKISATTCKRARGFSPETQISLSSTLATISAASSCIQR